MPAKFIITVGHCVSLCPVVPASRHRAAIPRVRPTQLATCSRKALKATEAAPGLHTGVWYFQSFGSPDGAAYSCLHIQPGLLTGAGIPNCYARAFGQPAVASHWRLDLQQGLDIGVSIHTGDPATCWQVWHALELPFLALVDLSFLTWVPETVPRK